MKNAKTHSILICLFLQFFLNTTIFCQDKLKESDERDIPKIEEEQKDTFSVQLKSIQNQLKDINKILQGDTTTTDVVGKLHLLKSASLNNDSDEIVEIKSVEISIKGGTIYSLRIKDNNGRVFFKDAIGIPIINLISNTSKKRKRYQVRQIDDQSKFIYITEVLRYEPAIGNPFLPEDGEVFLSPNFPSEDLKVGVDINSHVEFKVYTDLLALLNDNPNGLVQSELSSQINLVDHPVLGMLGHYLFYFSPYIEPSLRLRKFDSTDQYISLVEESDINSISEQSYYDLLQRSYLDLRVDWSLLYLNDGDQKFDFRAGIGYSLSNILLPDSSMVDQAFVTYRFGLQNQFLRYKNFGVSGTLNYTLIDLQKVKEFDTSSPMGIIEIAAEAFYFPLGNKKNKLYARFVLNTPTRNEEVIREHPFFQIGYQTKLGFKSKN